jgi:hypothetical protein
MVLVPAEAEKDQSLIPSPTPNKLFDVSDKERDCPAPKVSCWTEPETYPKDVEVPQMLEGSANSFAPRALLASNAVAPTNADKLTPIQRTAKENDGDRFSLHRSRVNLVQGERSHSSDTIDASFLNTLPSITGYGIDNSETGRSSIAERLSVPTRSTAESIGVRDRPQAPQASINDLDRNVGADSETTDDDSILVSINYASQDAHNRIGSKKTSFFEKKIGKGISHPYHSAHRDVEGYRFGGHTHARNGSKADKPNIRTQAAAEKWLSDMNVIAPGSDGDRSPNESLAIDASGCSLSSQTSLGRDNGTSFELRYPSHDGNGVFPREKILQQWDEELERDFQEAEEDRERQRIAGMVEDSSSEVEDDVFEFGYDEDATDIFSEQKLPVIPRSYQVDRHKSTTRQCDIQDNDELFLTATEVPQKRDSNDMAAVAEELPAEILGASQEAEKDGFISIDGICDPIEIIDLTGDDGSNSEDNDRYEFIDLSKESNDDVLFSDKGAGNDDDDDTAIRGQYHHNMALPSLSRNSPVEKSSVMAGIMTGSIKGVFDEKAYDDLASEFETYISGVNPTDN